MTRPQDRDLRLKALSRLAIATREKVEVQTFAVYLDDLKPFPTLAVERACRRLESTVTWFPKVAELVEACRIEARRIEEAAAQRRPKLAAGDRPVDPAKWAKFKDDVAAVIAKKGMP